MAETEQNQQSHKKRRLKPLLITVGIVAVAALAGAGLRWVQLDNANKMAAKPTAVQKKAFETQETALGGDFDAAHKELEDALDNSHLSTDERQYLINQQGATYENEGKFKEAQAKYQEAYDLKPTQNIAESLARAAEKAGDKQTAITYLKKAITLISKTNPVGEADKERYENMIRNLGGTP